MASYHFALHRDEKPDGEKVKAIEHIDYINRKGKYKDEGTKKVYSGNVITDSNDNNIINDTYALLYSSPYGRIANTPNGLEIDGEPSPQTILLAMTLALKSYPNPIKIKGSKKFINNVIETSAAADLDITFEDSQLNHIYLNRKEAYQNERRKSENNSGKNRKVKPGKQFTVAINSVNLCKPDLAVPEKHKIETLAGRKYSMQELPKCNLVCNRESDRPGMLLQSDAQPRMDEHREFEDNTLRWPASRIRSVKKANETLAERILEQVNNHKDDLALEHIEYINRENLYAARGDCIYTNHYLPKWSKNDPKKFFKAADKYESESNRKYTEFEFSLPSELPFEENLKIVNRFIKENMPNTYYAFAIHNKIGELSENQQHMHVHIMFSEREVDDVEKEKERTPECFFKYPKRGAKTNEEKRLGGAKKNRLWNNKNLIPKLRKSYAEITNKVLAENGFMERIDHRSIKDIRKEALIEGDEVLAEIMDRIPESYIGMLEAKKENSSLIDLIKNKRKINKKKKQLLLAIEEQEYIEDENKLQEKITEYIQIVKKLTKDPLFITPPAENVDMLKELLIEKLNEVNSIQKLAAASTINNIRKQAMLGCIPNNRKDDWSEYITYLERNRWISEMKSIYLQENNPYIKNLEEYEEQNNRRLIYAEENVKDIITKFETEEYQLKISSYIHNLIIDSKPLLKDLNNNLMEIIQLVDDIKYEFQNNEHSKADNISYNEHTSTDNSFINSLSNYTEDEISAEDSLEKQYSNLWKKLYGYKAEEKKLSIKVKKSKQNVISEARAVYIAKNIYTNKKLKTLRDEISKIKRRNKANYSETNITEIALLENEYNVLGKKLEAPYAASKIKLIAKRILAMNQPKVAEYEQLSQELSDLRNKISETQLKINEIKNILNKTPTTEKNTAVPKSHNSSGKSFHSSILFNDRNTTPSEHKPKEIIISLKDDKEDDIDDLKMYYSDIEIQEILRKRDMSR